VLRVCFTINGPVGLLVGYSLVQLLVHVSETVFHCLYERSISARERLKAN